MIIAKVSSKNEDTVQNVKMVLANIVRSNGLPIGCLMEISEETLKGFYVDQNECVVWIGENDKKCSHLNELSLIELSMLVEKPANTKELKCLMEEYMLIRGSKIQSIG